jgi:high-affinity iron transporter
MRRFTLALAAVVAVVLVAPGLAAAGGAPLGQARDEVRQARVLVDRALEQARAGNRDAAYRTARTAYLDHFERAEIPLRLRKPNLVLDLEFEFAELRNGIRDGKSIGSLEHTAAGIRGDLRSVDLAFSDAGVAAPAIAFLFSFSILFREGLEAVLLIAILLGSLEAGRASGYRRPLGYGVAGALVATLATWLAATLLIDIAPVQRELLEAGTALIAVAVLFVVTFWLVSQLEQRRRMEFMRARIAGAVAAGSAAAFAGLGFTAVYREGFETALFYQALALFAQGLVTWVLLGALAAALALVGVGYAVLRLGKRLPIKPLLMTGASILLLLSVTFAGNAVRSLQESDVIGVTPIDSSWARPPVFVAELTGIHPTRQGVGVQLAMLALYVAGALYMFAWRPIRRRSARVVQA